jgi:hypothetical protein
VYELLAWLEGSALGRAMRESGVWTYGLVNLAHILGVASLFGPLLVLDLRLLGLWRRIPIAAIAAPLERVATAGFAVAATSGLCLLATNATEYIGNPFLPIKFTAIAVGLANVGVLKSLPGWQARGARAPTPRESRHLAAAGGISLLAWLTAVGAGRMIGYW